MTILTVDKSAGKIEVIPNIKSIHISNGQMVIIKKEGK